MDKYYCECCGYRAKQKSHFTKHLSSKKHAKISHELAKISQNLAKISQKSVKIDEKTEKNEPNNTVYDFPCKYCNKTFKHHSSLSKHIKYACKKNKDEDLQELVRLLNQKNEIKDKQITEILNQNKKMQRQIDKLTSKLQIQHIHNTNSNNNTINYNIKLLNFNQTDYSHLTEQDYMKCLQDCNYCVKSLIEKVHFNEEKPENKNIYISNIKNKYIMLYKNNKWQLVNRKNQLDDLYDYNEVLLENWHDEYKDKYPDMFSSFERYLKNKDNDDELTNQIKDEILLMLYNNRVIEEET